MSARVAIDRLQSGRAITHYEASARTGEALGGPLAPLCGAAMESGDAVSFASTLVDCTGCRAARQRGKPAAPSIGIGIEREGR